MKLFFVLVIVVIFAGPTFAKTFSKQPQRAKKRGLFYRAVRRFGFAKVTVASLVVVVVVPTVIYVTLGHA